MQSELLSLGIDTSNYKTSVAVVDCSGKVLFNHQEYLEVKKENGGSDNPKLSFSMCRSCRTRFKKRSVTLRSAKISARFLFRHVRVR